MGYFKFQYRYSKIIIFQPNKLNIRQTEVSESFPSHLVTVPIPFGILYILILPQYVQNSNTLVVDNNPVAQIPHTFESTLVLK